MCRDVGQILGPKSRYSNKCPEVLFDWKAGVVAPQVECTDMLILLFACSVHFSSHHEKKEKRKATK